MTNDHELEITRNPQTGRFERVRDPDTAYLEYRCEQDRFLLVHTQVADELEGQGVGSALVREALAYAQAENLTIVPECPFVASWLERHPDRAAELRIASR